MFEDEDRKYDEDDEDREEQDYDEDDDGDDDGDFEAERAAFERVGRRAELGDFIMNTLKGDKKLEKIQRRMMIESMSDRDKFLMIVNNFASRVFEDDIGQILEPHKSAIELIVDKISHIKYKNPVAFLLGYFVIYKKKKKEDVEVIEFINMDKLRRLLSVCRENDIEGITMEDIIRYSRLIQNYSK